MTASRASSSIRRVGIIGHGYVGRGTANALASVVEVAWHDPAVAGSRPFGDLGRWAEALLICVPTPTGECGAADLGVVHDVVDQLAVCGAMAPVVLRSTVPPGTTDALARRAPGLGFVYWPEFLRERHYLEDAASPARVVLGWSTAIDPGSRANVRELLVRRFADVPLVDMTATAAEIVKYASNALFGVKVAFANEMADLAARLGTDWEPIRAALVLDPRVGPGHLAVPGPDGQRGFGGTCLPKDMSALLAVASELKVDLDVVAAAVRANRRWRDG